MVYPEEAEANFISQRHEKSPPSGASVMEGMLFSGLFKLIFARPANRTGPVIGDVGKGSPGSYPIVGIPGSGIILIAADNTGVFFHRLISFFA
jgi:hypothetical protein